jgi:hypothetical protein
MHLINQFIKQLPSNYKSRHVHIILVVSQLTYLMFFKEKVRKYLLTSCTRSNPLTLLTPNTMEYHALLYVMLENLTG